MKIIDRLLNDVIILRPEIFLDKRGHFFESFNEKKFLKLINKNNIKFVQDNHSHNKKGSLRGLHYQTKNTQSKLVRVIDGEIFDVVVDVRKKSKNFGKWAGINLSHKNLYQIWIPPGFAHGFLTLSSSADIVYKVDKFYDPDSEKCIIWNDTDINIKWPTHKEIIQSVKDQNGESFKSSMKL